MVLCGGRRVSEKAGSESDFTMVGQLDAGRDVTLHNPSLSQQEQSNVLFAFARPPDSAPAHKKTRRSSGSNSHAFPPFRRCFQRLFLSQPFFPAVMQPCFYGEPESGGLAAGRLTHFWTRGRGASL